MFKKNSLKAGFATLALGLSLILSGCTRKEKTIGGAIIGGAAGATIGGLAGGPVGAAIGGGAGLIGGGIIGHASGKSSGERSMEARGYVGEPVYMK